MDKREQVFVSSTYLDLLDERQRVNQILLQLNCFPAGMELFPASDADKWDLIKGVIDDSDYYLLILGGRYGSVDDATDLSYTEMEYKYANEQNKPIMAFLHQNLDKLVHGKMEKDPEKAAKLDAFRALVSDKRTVRYYEKPDELAAAVATSLVALRSRYPAVGWVRGDNAMTPETRTEIAELRAAVAEGRSKIEAASEPVFDDLADGDDQFTFDGNMTFRSTDNRQYDGEFAWQMSWNEAFRELGPILLHETTDSQVGVRLDQAMRSMVYEDPEPKSAPDDFEYNDLVELMSVHLGDTRSVLDDVLVQFLALRLIERGTQRRGINDSARYWKLTAKGEDRLMAMRAVRHEPSD